MARTPKPALAPDRPVMVRVAANRLGRDAICVVPGCRGELRIEELGGYTVEVCTKCERRLQLWGALETRVREASTREHRLEADRVRLQAEVVALRGQVAGLRATPLAKRSGVTPSRTTTPALILAALEVADRQLLFAELSALLPPTHAKNISPVLTYMSRTGRIRAVKLPWGKRFRCAYSLPRAS